jgi:hypothetical protein
MTTADRINYKVDQWLRATREEIFEPIGEQVRQIWSVLNSDTDLRLTKIGLTGGTQRQRKVQLDLASGDLAIPAGKNNSAILSTGQRNALSLATYLPRATQPHRIESDPRGGLTVSCKAVGKDVNAFRWDKSQQVIVYEPRDNDEFALGIPDIIYQTAGVS